MWGCIQTFARTTLWSREVRMLMQKRQGKLN
jgi:hypothetical protein